MEKSKSNQSSAFAARRLVVSLLLIFCSLTVSKGDYSSFDVLLRMPYYKTKVYYQPGDILIGVIAYVSIGDSSMICSNRSIWSPSPLNIEAIPFAINSINNNSYLLPNVSLGFVVLDGCSSDRTTLAAATHFIGRYVVSGRRTNDTCNRQNNCSAYEQTDDLGNYDFNIVSFVAETLS